MKLLILLFLFISSGYSKYLEKEFDVGTGDKLTLRIAGEADDEQDFYYSLESKEEDVDEDEEDEEDESHEITNGIYDPEGIPDYIEHDCNTVRPFNPEDPYNFEPAWVGKNIERRSKKGIRSANKVTQYNHAYGIVVFGQAHIKPETMKRACYLIRFLMASNEGMRRIAYSKGMYVYAERGGFATGQAANVGNAGLSCPCSLAVTFPMLQIYTTAHEIAHWWINRIGAVMHASGYLKLPEFINNDEWSWKDNVRHKRSGCGEEVKKCCRETTETDPQKQSAYIDFLYNSVAQDRATVWKAGAGKKGKDIYRSGIDCGKTHHYFIYTGQDNYLGLASGGEPKYALRDQGHEKNPNLFNLLDQIWQCDNTYLSVCEDAAYGFTKGPNTKLIIGKSDPNDRSKAICHEDLDTKEIPDEQVQPLMPVPTADEEFERDEKTQNWVAANKCIRVLKRGTELGTKWLTTDNPADIDFEALVASLDDSNERAWWLRKCCATTAGFNQ